MSKYLRKIKFFCRLFFHNIFICNMLRIYCALNSQNNDILWEPAYTH
jgi:hypothetical protein